MAVRCTKLGVSLLAAWQFGGAGVFAATAPDKARRVDDVLHAYIEAVGGQAAIDRIETRQTDADRHHGPKVTYFWQKPDKVLMVTKNEKIGFAEGSGWVLSKKKKVTRLAKGAQKPLEMDANPLRFVHLRQIYDDLQPGKPEVQDGKPVDVLVAPNDIGATKLYFDSGNHLLVRVEEQGETSAYYKHVTDYSDYETVDGVKLPFRIVHSSTEPGAKAEELRISKVAQNIPLRPEIFMRPNVAGVVLGGKR